MPRLGHYAAGGTGKRLTPGHEGHEIPNYSIACSLSALRALSSRLLVSGVTAAAGDVPRTCEEVAEQLVATMAARELVEGGRLSHGQYTRSRRSCARHEVSHLRQAQVQRPLQVR